MRSHLDVMYQSLGISLQTKRAELERRCVIKRIVNNSSAGQRFELKVSVLRNKKIKFSRKIDTVMKRLLLIAVVAVMAEVNVNAQIASQVIEVLKKSQEIMNSPQGTEMEMALDVTLMVKLAGM